MTEAPKSEKNIKTLKGEGIRLDQIVETDAANIYRACQDPTLQHWTMVPRPYECSHASGFIAFEVPEIWSKGGAIWAIRERKGGELRGVIDLRTCGTDEYQVGYWIDPEFRSAGLMTKAFALATEAAFEVMGAQRILWRAMVDNWASWKVAWRLGFQREGTIRGKDYGGRRVDLWSAGLLATDERGRPAAPWDGPNPGMGALPDPRDPDALVRQFHEVYGLPIDTTPTVDRDRVHMRMGLILEEVSELVGAVYGPAARADLEQAITAALALDDHTRDVVESADALADLTYVVYGMALECGIDLPQVLAEVQASNMSKLGKDGRPIYRADGKVLKGPGFFEPNIARALGLTGSPQQGQSQ